MFTRVARSLFLSAAAVAAGAGAQAADVTVFSGGAVKSAFTAASAAWEAKSGHKVKATFAPAGDLRKKVAAGEPADVLVIPAENLPEMEKAGAIDVSTRRDLGAVAMGAAVRQGAKVPDISTPEALRRTLTEVKSLTYMDPSRGTSGKHFDESVLPKLGIRDAVRAKATLGEGGFIAEKVARGEVEIAFHQMTEMIPVAGVTIVGPLPAELQKTTVYSAVLMKSARHPREAQALLDYLVSPEGRKAFLDRGFTAP
ncbi:MAG TPA: molybdate ABC transporter substrate-binding protein [Usitatibacter sp.]|nr:molybdate ABC transporter substrate-binding protein [Usitatibacter sp.]